MDYDAILAGVFAILQQEIGKQCCGGIAEVP